MTFNASTSREQSSAGALATATLKVVGVPLPTSVAQRAKIRPTEKIDLFVPERGRITARRAKNNSGTPLTVAWNTPNVFAYGRNFIQTAGLAAGDVVAFDRVEDGEISFHAIDPLRDPLYLNPLRDQFGHPIPPGWLAQAFTDRPDPEAFMKGGARTAEILAVWTAASGLQIEQANLVVDFGCGCGRVMNFLADMTTAKFVGCDLHGPAINWCKNHLRMGQFLRGTTQPPLPLGANSVDFLYAISVLTHLDEALQNAWLDEWRRIVRPGGLVVATFHGDDYVANHLANKSEYKAKIDDLWKANAGIAFLDNDAWAHVFPDFYQTTYHTIDYVTRVWARYFEIVEIKRYGEFANSQNVAIMLKP